ncbi:hypothetical protein NKW45_05810 [Acetobacter orientalis]|uniref:hypothetical protein n=1 Tax=Acetobacter orientalis TaxID=146474 RepID=UPI0020A3CEA7|nr:hypothetical protein [Acetobacter orientalis]MCP1221362.1 hypothetical protein [Acetobacter orientalis]
MASFFLDLDKQEHFTQKIGQFYSDAPSLISSVITCNVTSDREQIASAYSRYQDNLSFFSRTVRSGNPDHCKRAAALLQALYAEPIISKLCFPVDLEELDGGFSPISFRHADIKHALPYIRLYNENYNEIFSFSISFKIWCLYEQTYKECTLDYVKNICAYLKQNRDSSLDDLFMIFKSLSQ